MKATPIILILLVFALSIVPVSAGRPPHSDTVFFGDLIADGGPDGAQLDIGDLSLYTYYYTSSNGYDPEGRALAFVIDMASGWEMTEVYVDVESNPSQFPTNKAGNPTPGQFWLTHDDLEGITGLGTNSDSFPSDLSESMWLHIAVHVVAYNAELDISEGAWVRGLTAATTGDFSGSSWATYVSYESPAYT